MYMQSCTCICSHVRVYARVYADKCNCVVLLGQAIIIIYELFREEKYFFKSFVDMNVEFISISLNLV